MSKIVDLRNLDLVFTTSFFFTHGVCGHLYEMIEYCYITRRNGINSGILLADGVTKEVFEQTLKDKYVFTEEEYNDIVSNTYECFQPKIIRANNVCLVDGSWRILNCVMYADNVFLLRCSEGDFTFFDKHKSIKRTHLLQDFKLYDERFENLDINVEHYIKKILWGKYKQPNLTKTNTALLYLTTSTRSTSLEYVQKLMEKKLCDNYLIVTNMPELYKSLEAPNVRVELAPLNNIHDLFDTYIYTPTRWKSDCSPRFIVECAVYGKQVVYEIDYVCRGIERRIEDIEEDLGALELKDGDYFIEYVKQNIYEKSYSN